MSKTFVYCYASGQMEIGSSLPDGALPIFIGSADEALKIQQRGRLAYDGETWLVPGIPEADKQEEAYEAFVRFKNWAAPSTLKQAAALRKASRATA